MFIGTMPSDADELSSEEKREIVEMEMDDEL